MKRAAHSFVIALALVSSLSGSTGPTPDEADTPLTAVTKRASYVFASTPHGLYRASLETKRWERLKTPPEMPPDGTFAAQPGPSPLVIYVAMRSQLDRQPRPGSRYGLYLSHDHGATWELASERDDFGATLLLPGGALFAVVGDDGVNHGDRLLRSPDLGKTWRDITGTASGQFMGLGPDRDRPGLVRIHARSTIRSFTFVADDEKYQWRMERGEKRKPGRRPSDEFFSRGSSSTIRLSLYQATLSNYFGYDFGNQKTVPALEVVPLKTRFEFARGRRVAVPIRVVLHADLDAALARWRKSAAAGHPSPKPIPATEKFADQPGGIDFWGLRVESADDQVETYPEGRRMVTTTTTVSTDGKSSATSTQQPERVKYQVFKLSPSSPYEREIDLGRLADFTKPGEYRVQILYDSGGHPVRENDEWDGSFTSPVFTVVVRE